MTEIECVVHRTTHRADANGEFIIRLTRATQRRVAVRAGDYVVVKASGGKVVPGYRSHAFEVLAAVRDLRPDDVAELAGPPASHAEGCGAEHVRMDATLREAIGGMAFEEQPDRARITLHAAVKQRHTGWLTTTLGFQFVMCRVQKARSGDAETYLCRASEAVMQALGAEERVPVVVQSAQRTASIRMLPTSGEDSASPAQHVTSATLDADIGPNVDYEEYLEMGEDSTWRLPSIHLDREARDRLRVVPGQAVWVRRDPRVLLEAKIPTILSTVFLAVFTTVVAGSSSWSTRSVVVTAVGSGALAACVCLVFAAIEVRGSMRKP